MPQYDVDDEQYKYQMDMANALRQKALDVGGEQRGRIYVRKSPWENLIQGLAGSYMGSKALAERQALEGQRQQDVQNWLGQVPQASTQKEITGPPQPGQTMPTVSIPKDPRQLAGEMQQWGIQGANLKSPLAQAVAQQAIQHALTMPEKEAERRMQAEVAQQQILARALEARRTREEADARRAEERALDRENQRILRTMVAGQGRANADIDREIKEFRLDEMKRRAAEGTVGERKLKLAQEEKQKTLSEAESNLDTMLAKGGPLEKATGSGVGTLVDAAARAVGVSTEGARETRRLAVLADPILKAIPRFEGPQSDKDTLSYKEAAGMLADPTSTNEERIAAAKELKRLYKARRGQFTIAGEEPVPTVAPPVAPPAGASDDALINKYLKP